MSDYDKIETVAEWAYNGRRCKVVKQSKLGHYCGYIQTGLRFGYDDGPSYRLIDINGGLTYGVDADGWVGFDCAHSWDVCIDDSGDPWGRSYEGLGHEPMELSRHGSIEACREADGATVWDVDAVKEECEKLADQIDALENIVEACKTND